MEEKDLDAQIEDQKKQRRIESAGLILGFLIGAIAIVAGSIVAVKGYQFAGSVIGGGGIAGLVSTFIMGRQKEKVEEEISEDESLPDQSEEEIGEDG